MNRSGQTAGGATDLAAIVSEANEWAQRLLQVLDDEREALRAGDASQIDNVGQCKTECVSRLEVLERERVDMCRALTVDEDDLDGFLTQHHASGDSDRSWLRFLARLEQCRQANTVNGQVTHLRRRHVERALQILRGQGDADAGLYGPTGLDDARSASTLGLA